VGFNGSNRQSQLRRNRLVTHSEHQVPEDVSFPARKRLLLHAIGYTGRSERAQRDAAQLHGPQTGSELLQTAPQQQVTAGALFECVADLRLTVTMREYHQAAAER